MFLPKLTPLTLGFVCTTFGIVGCGTDTTSADDLATGDGDGDGDGDSGDGDTGEASADTGDGDGDTSTDTGEPEASYPARGISITEVEANQGTAIFIGDRGEWIEGSARLGPLVKNRDTLIRVHYELEPNFTPRDIEARLRLEFPDGTARVYTNVRNITGPAQPNLLAGTFIFGLVADAGDVVPGVDYQVELHEIDASAGTGEPEGVWQTPAEPMELGIQPEPMELKVVFVPYHHLYQDIDRTTDTSDATMALIVDYLYEQNPVEDLVWELHEPLLWDLPMDNLGSVLGPLAAVRDNEFAEPNVYYHALFPVPNGGVAGVAGVASVPGDGKGEGGSRVSVTALGNNPSGARGVVVHEVGHNQGLQHVFCPFAQAASPDPSYHDPNGLIRGWGFGIVSFQLYSPENHYDYMSYCNPSWVSRWSWGRTFNRIRTLTSWDYEGPDQGGLDFDLGPTGYVEHDLLMASINGDGTEFWWTGHGSLPSNADPYGDDYDHYLELRDHDGQLVETLAAVVRYTNDYSTAWVIAELPPELAGLEGIEEIVRVDDNQLGHPVTRDSVQLSQR